MSKNKLQTCLRIISVLVFQLLLASCFSLDSKAIDPTEHPNLVDQSWLSDQLCTVPCWYGLILGESSRVDAIAVAESLAFLDSKDVKLMATTGASFLCKEPPNEVCVAMGFEHGVLSNLWIYPNYQITLEQVVKKLGPPDSFYFSYKDPESKNCNLSLLWLHRQIILGHSETQHGFQDDLCDRIYKEKGKIPKGLLVQGVNYKTLNEIKMIIETIQEPGTGQNYMLWKGFSD